MGQDAIDLKGLMLGDALDRAKASFDFFEVTSSKKPEKKPVKRLRKKATKSWCEDKVNKASR